MKLHTTYHTFTDWPDNTAPYGALALSFHGCDNSCPGCQNIQLKPYSASETSVDEVLDTIFQKGRCMPTGFYKHLVFTGGDPFGWGNRESICQILDKLIDDFKIMVYTGCSLEEIKKFRPKATFFKCGGYVRKLAQPSGHIDGSFHLASTNQILADASFTPLSSNGIYSYKGI